MRRRSFFVASAAAGLSIYARGGEHRSTERGDIPKRVFGKTGERLTIVGQAGGRFPLCGYEDAKAVTLRAYELGVNYFDNARIFEKSLRALNTDYVDLWQIHQVSTMDEVEQIFAPGGAIEAFEAAKKAGKCRFIGFTGHHDPEVHLAMLKRYDKYDSILMPLNPADPAYLSFEKNVLPVAVERRMGIQAMKSTANAKLLQAISVKDCLSYVLSLPIHCLALGCTTLGQIEDDVRIARHFKPLAEERLAQIRADGARLKGPQLEDWKKSTEEKADRPTASKIQHG